MVQCFDDDVPCHLEPATEIIPDRDAELVAGLGQTEESIATVAAAIAACSGTDLPPCDVTADVVFGAIGVERNLRPLQYHQQCSLVGVQPREQTIQRGEAGTAAEDGIEPGPQRPRPTVGGVEPVSLEAGVEVPDQTADLLLRRALVVIERVQLVHQ